MTSRDRTFTTLVFGMLAFLIFTLILFNMLCLGMWGGTFTMLFFCME